MVKAGDEEDDFNKIIFADGATKAHNESLHTTTQQLIIYYGVGIIVL